MLKAANKECTPLFGKDDEPSRIAFGGACLCNKLADELKTDLCDAICPRPAALNDCVCKNYLKAGSWCDDDVCQLDGVAYCTIMFSSRLKRCDKNLNYDRVSDFPYCKCSTYGGRFSNGRCQCNQHYSGTFCDDYNPPSIKNQRDDYNPASTLRPRDTKKDANLSIAIPVVIAIIALITIAIIGWKCRRRYPYGYGYGYWNRQPPQGYTITMHQQIQQPQPQPQFAFQGQQPYTTGQPYPPGQPVYGQPAPYGFQAPNAPNVNQYGYPNPQAGQDDGSRQPLQYQQYDNAPPTYHEAVHR